MRDRRRAVARLLFVFVVLDRREGTHCFSQSSSRKRGTVKMCVSAPVWTLVILAQARIHCFSNCAFLGFVLGDFLDNYFIYILKNCKFLLNILKMFKIL